MKIKSGVRLSQAEVLSLLYHFDDSSDNPLHNGLDFKSYSKKLSEFAYFILAMEANCQVGFIAYYLNKDRNFVFIPQVVVHRDGRHKGIGHAMFACLYDAVDKDYQSIQLEVLKENEVACRFYDREGFVNLNDNGDRYLLQKIITTF